MQTTTKTIRGLIDTAKSLISAPDKETYNDFAGVLDGLGDMLEAREKEFARIKLELVPEGTGYMAHYLSEGKVGKQGGHAIKHQRPDAPLLMEKEELSPEHGIIVQTADRPGRGWTVHRGFGDKTT